jgi:WD40 repeat protein
MNDAGAGEKLKVFISYSRKDSAAFADELVAGLEYGGFAPFLDRHDIVAGEEWEARLGGLIEQSDTVVFIVSPEAIKSDRCVWEVDKTLALSKRLLPVVHIAVPDSLIPEKLSRLQFVRFDAGRGVTRPLQELADALRQDLNWIREHTRLGEIATRWDTRGRPESLLLRGDDIDAAKKWMAARNAAAPEITDAQRAFIRASEEAEAAQVGKERAQLKATARLQRITRWAFAAVGAMIVIAGATVGYLQWDKARQLERESRFLIDQANQWIKERDAGTAMLLALQAMPDMHSGIKRPLVHEAEATLFNAYQELQERIVLGHKSSVWSASIAPDGRRIVTASEDNTARVWDAENGGRLATLRGHTGPVRAAAFSPDSRQLITTSTDKTTRVWNVETGKQSAVLEHDGVVRSSAFSPDGKHIVTASDDKTARIWDAQTGRQIAVLMGHTAPVRAAVFSPNGGYVLTTSEDRTACLWDAETGKLIHILQGHRNQVRSAAFSPDGERAITTSLDHSARVWDVQAGKQSAVLEHDGVVWSAVFNPDGRRIVTASDDKTARVWDAETGRQIAVLTGHTASVRSAVFSGDGRSIVTASDDSTARIWNAESGNLAIVLMGHLSDVKSAVFSPDGRHVLTASGDTTARIWSTKTQTSTPTTVLTVGSGPVRSAVFSPDGRRVLTASDDNWLWDAEMGQQIAIFSSRGAQFATAAFSPDGRLVAMPDKNDVVVREANIANTEHRVLQGHSAAVLSATFSPNGRYIVTASDDKTARVWDAETGRQIAVLTGHTASVRSAVFSPDGMRVVSTQMARRSDIITSDDSAALLWNALSGEVIRRFEGHEAQLYDATFSPDGKRIVTASADNTARIWDVATGTTIAVLKGHSGSVLSAAFSPHADRIATASADNTARIWGVATGSTIAVLKGHSGPVSSAVFGPDGERILTASDDGTARIWRVFPSAQALVDQSKVRVPRCLTLEQRKNAFLGPQPPAWCFELKKWPYQTID